MSYQPRRVADFVDEPTVEVAAEVEAPVVARRAANSLTDRLFHKGAAVLAAVTVFATAGAVAIGSTDGIAAAAGMPAPATVSGGPLIAESLVLSAPVTLKSKAASSTLALSRQYTTGSLNVRAAADVKAELLGKLNAAVRVEATSQIDGDYRKIVFEDGFGWVLTDELSDADVDEVPVGTSMAACSRGSKVENKLRKTTIFIYRSVCPLFPAVNSYGGWRAGGRQFHKNGRALDIMLTPGKESALGHRIASYLIAHASLFKVDHIIFEQRIWTPSSRSWKKMADRGSANANHFNHVHVAIKASAS